MGGTPLFAVAMAAVVAVRRHAAMPLRWSDSGVPYAPRGVAGASQMHGAGGLTAQFK